MKRVVICLFIILVISFAVSLLVSAEETNNLVLDPIDKGYITTNIRIDNSITKLNFFKKNINVIVEYKKGN